MKKLIVWTIVFAVVFVMTSVMAVADQSKQAAPASNSIATAQAQITGQNALVKNELPSDVTAVTPAIMTTSTADLVEGMATMNQTRQFTGAQNQKQEKIFGKSLDTAKYSLVDVVNDGRNMGSTVLKI